MNFIKVKELFEIKKGKKVEQIEAFKEGCIRYIQIDDLRNNNNIKFCNEEKSYIISNSDDIIIAWDGANAGTIGYGLVGAIGSTLAILRKKDNNFNTEYCGLFLKSKFNYLRDKCAGATIPHISRSSLEELEVPNIGIEKQKKIANILNLTQELIDKRKEQIEELDLLIKSKFIEMFGDPVLNPKGWNKQIMNDVAPVVNYKGKFNEEKIWLLNLDRVESNTGKIIDFNYVSIDDIGNSTCTFDTTNVLYSKLRPYLNKVVIPKEIGYATSEMVPLQPIKGTLNRYYLTYMLRSKAFVEYISEKVVGAKMPRVSMNDFRSFEVAIPPIELQIQFENFVKQVDKLKVEMEQSLKKLEDNFNSLMQKAFKGELFI
ncbi:restriction endonuclease subunit S [Clostridium perfringens]|uniref:restriction endonuclease subunit S n=1 Tax=Clostridium perfringens TaxID=1502 RepID=UPI00232BEC64|nr:restriction endonuclease subunit S [Clostridium perfringens]MDB2043002.1 restriction endonuclease subunit S [Clostridium perfringens]MDB2055785.1 restriction endonuclease subunit S [Clostridium perfringens]MDM0678082.1 restriction endonuclease subunit S [Clostridium perfringens]MDM0681190.1 restriction endonuclease subunit S [Clostridium perfringens]MDM0683909.1 restriction endonuclease subunit S [Clostridium perfringens]